MPPGALQSTACGIRGPAGTTAAPPVATAHTRAAASAPKYCTEGRPVAGIGTRRGRASLSTAQVRHPSPRLSNFTDRYSFDLAKLAMQNNVYTRSHKGPIPALCHQVVFGMKHPRIIHPRSYED